MIVSITNNIITDLKTKFPTYDVLREYPMTNPKLPCIIIDEGDLPIDLGTMDSGGYHHTNYDITLEIYTNGSGKISKSNDIREGINDILGKEYGLQRIFSKSIPNLVDSNVYRYRLTYVGKLDKNKTIFRR